MKEKRWTQVLNIVLCTISGLFIFNVTNVWAQQPRGDYYGPHMMWNGGWFGMFLGPILMIVFIGIAVVVVVLLIRWLGGSTSGPVPLLNPREILWTF